MQATRDFYQKRASALTTLAERAKSKGHRSDLMTLAQAWRDLACGWEVESDPRNHARLSTRTDREKAKKEENGNAPLGAN
jgi:hypothetical protein